MSFCQPHSKCMLVPPYTCTGISKQLLNILGWPSYLKQSHRRLHVLLGDVIWPFMTSDSLYPNER